MLAACTNPRVQHGVQVVSVETPFAGSEMFAPRDGGPHPGVLLLHGSNGGRSTRFKLEAQMLAYEGFAALAYCYAGCATGSEEDVYLPRVDLHHVALDKTYEALDWLARSPQVAGRGVAVYGVSRGAEQTLLLATLLAEEPKLTQPKALAAHAPSDIVVPAWNWQWLNPLCKLASGGAWSERCGLPPLPDGAPLPPAWTWRGGVDAVPIGGHIAVERLKMPVLITHGAADRVWDANRTRRIEAAMRAVGASPEVHVFPDEDHGFDAEAEARRKELLLAFLRRHLHATM